MSIQESNKLIEQLKNEFAQQQDFSSWDEMLDESNGSIYDSMVDGVLEVAIKRNTRALDSLQKIQDKIRIWEQDNGTSNLSTGIKEIAFPALTSYADAAPPTDPNEHPDQAIFDQYSEIKKKIGELGYMAFISSKEVEEYREWLRNDKYKHRLEWFEKEYPNGLYSKDEDGNLFGINILTKKFLVEADAAWEGTVTGKSAGVWVKCSKSFPEDPFEKIIRNQFTKKLILEQDVEEMHGEYFEMKDGTQLDYWNCEWLDESGEAGKQPTHAEAEREVLAHAFDKVRKLFELRSWIMDGRGSYPYNDDRYKEEVRYLYDEFDALAKDTWANIQSKTFEYREKIIAEYLKEQAGKQPEQQPAVEKEGGKK